MSITVFSEKSQSLQSEKSKLNQYKQDKLALDRILQDIKIQEEEILKFTESYQQALIQSSDLEVQKKSIESNIEEKTKKKETLTLTASLEEHRSALIEGEPCPLCGALHHPYANTKFTDIGILEVEISEAKEKLHQLTNKLDQSNRLQAEHKGKTETLINTVANKKNELTEKVNEINSLGMEEMDENTLQERLQKIEAEISGINKVIQWLDEYALLNPLVAPLTELINLNNQETDFLAKNNKYNVSDNLTDIIDNYIKDFDQKSNILIGLDAERTKQLQDIEDQQHTIDEMNNNLLQGIAKLNYSRIEDAELAIMDQSEVDRIYERYKNEETKLAVLKNEYKDSSTKLTKLEQITDQGVELTAVVLEKERLTEENARLHQEIGSTERMLEDNKKKEVDQKSHLEMMADKTEKIKVWKVLKDLIGDADGRKYAEFAQTLTLELILAIANDKLRGFTDRYSLVLKNEDLYIVDHHMGNVERNVKTLSGGETFITSLALALGLSDLASQNVKIECLFIDEGFGTLDEQTLDMVITTLEKLQQDSSKLIGIISHIDYLKERIATQIELLKGSNGVSEIRIVA
jgi:exonuclease SbcC